MMCARRSSMSNPICPLQYRRSPNSQLPRARPERMTSHAFHVEQTAPPPSACGGQASACSCRCQSTSRCRGKAIYIRIVHRLRARETESPHRLLCRKLHISGVGPSACTTMLSAGHMVHRTWHAPPMPSRSVMRARHLVLNLVLTISSATNPRDELSLQRWSVLGRQLHLAPSPCTSM